jgi:hypothetical protein
LVASGCQTGLEHAAKSRTALRAELRASLYVPVEELLFFEGDPDDAEERNFNDDQWKTVKLPHQWETPDSVAWYRARVKVPESIGGYSVSGQRVDFSVSADDRVMTFVDGKRQGPVSRVFHDRGVMARQADPARTYYLALRVNNNALAGGLRHVRLTLPARHNETQVLADFLDQLDAIEDGVWSESEMRLLVRVQDEALAELDVQALADGNMDSFHQTVSAAAERLAAGVAEVARPYHTRLDALHKRIEASGEMLDAAESDTMPYSRATRAALQLGVTYAIKDLELRSVPHLTRTIALMPALENMADRLEDELSVGHHPDVPWYQTGPVAIDGGAFTQGGRPLFFTGFGHFQQVRDDLPKFKAMGFNVCQLVCSSPLNRRGEVDSAPVEQLKAALDSAAEHDIGVDVLLHPTVPSWMYDEHLELQHSGWGFVPYDLGHPKVREHAREFLRQYLQTAAGHPAVFSYCLMNEPLYTDGSALSRLGFQRYLQRKYGDLETINGVCKTKYKTVADIPAPDVTKTVHENRAFWLEWCRYNDARLVEYHRWMRDIIREYDPDTPIHTKIMGIPFDGQRYTAWGMDHERFANLGRISGNDRFNHYTPDGPYAQKWVAQQIYYVLQRSMAPANPIFNSENHLIDDGNARFIPGRHVRTALWIGAMEGLGANTNWFWEWDSRQYPGATYMNRANCVEALGRTNLDLNRFGHVFAAFPNVSADIAILYDSASLVLNDPYGQEVQRAFEGLYLLDRPIDFVTSQQIATGKLANHKVVVVPNATYVSQQTFDALVAFAREGGHLLVTGDSLTHDEHGNRRDISTLFHTDALPVNSVVKHTMRSGVMQYMSGSQTPEVYANAALEMCAKLGLQPWFHLRGSSGRRPPGILARGVEVNGARYVSVVNLGQARAQVRLDTADGDTWYDLVEEKRVSGSVALASLQPRLLRLEKD